MIRNMKISHKLIMGYVIVILLTVWSGVISVSSLIQTASFSDGFYNHPFTVTTAALQAKADMIEMRSTMKDVITANSESDIEKIQDKVNSLEQSVYLQFVIMHQRFLGDPLLVDKAEELFKQWKSTRDEVFMLALGGKREEADKIITGRATEQVGEIFNEMKQVMDFAQREAQEFNGNANITSKNAQTNIVIVIILVVIVSVIIAIFIIRSALFQISYIDVLNGQTLAESKQELIDTVREQQGGIFKFKKVNECFIHTLCDGQLFYQNGINPEKVVGNDLQAIFPQSLFFKVQEHYQLAWEGKENSYEIPWLGDKIFVVFLRPVFREEKVIEVVGSIMDITERKKMEEELRASKEWLESFINHSTDAIGILDLDGNVLRINKAHERMFGWSEQEAIGKIQRPIPDYLMDEALEIFRKVASGESITGFETVRQLKDGSFIDVSLTASPIRDSMGNVIALSGIIRDITERKKTEKELSRLYRQIELILNSVGEGIYGIDQQGEISFMNPSGMNMLGYSLEEVIHTHPHQFLHDPYAEMNSHSYQECPVYAKIHQGTLLGNTVFWRKEGTSFQVEYTSKLILERGIIVGRVVTFRDITERLKTEELLRKSEKLAVVGQLAAGIAHEIRNPLTSIKGFLQLMGPTTNENKKWYMDVMLTEIARIEWITNEFMMAAKPQTPNFHPKDVGILLEQVITLLDPQAIMNNVQIITEFEANIPLVLCDGNQLKQVFINILKNSIEAMPSGGDIILKLNKLDYNRVLIRCIDQGYGLPKERIPHLGEPFFSLKEKGTGLGLMMCYKIIEEHKGEICIESEINQGTIVDVILPIIPPF